MTIYKQILSLQINDKISVDVTRNQSPMKIEYILKELKTHSRAVVNSATPKTSVEMQTPYEDLRKEQLESLKQRHQFAPTVEEIREKERANMMRNGRSTVVQHPKDTNE
jgi:hypothetical protein